MLRAAHGNTILVVEGATDFRLYRKFIDHDGVSTVIANSKSNVRGVVKETTRRRKMKGVIGIVDADLDYLNHKGTEKPIFRTDTRDSESMILFSGSLEAVLCEYADEEKLSRFESFYGNVADCVVNAAYPVGLLMFVSSSNGLDLSFKNLDFEAFISKRDLRCDIPALCRSVLNNSIRVSVSVSKLQSLLENAMSKGYDPHMVCRGHDLVSVLKIGLRNIFGSSNAARLGDSAIGSAMRLSYDDDRFVETELYKDTESYSKSEGVPLWRKFRE